MDKTDITLKVIWELNDLIDSVNTLDEKKAMMRGFNLGMYMGCLLRFEDVDKLMKSLMTSFVDRFSRKDD